MSIWVVVAIAVLSATNQAQCNYDGMKKGAWSCAPINIDVYKPIPASAGSWDQWLKLALSGVGGLHPGIHIVSFGVSQLTDVITGSYVTNPNTKEMEFQSQVNKAFKQTTECIDDKIIKSVTTTATTKLETLEEKFTKLKTDYKTATDDVFATQFQIVWNEMHNFIKHNFDLSKTKWTSSSVTFKEYLAYLALFKETALAFDQINTAYLLYLKEVKKSDGDFMAKYKSIEDDANDLNDWIEKAQDMIFDLDAGTNNMPNWDPIGIHKRLDSNNRIYWFQWGDNMWGEAYGVTDKRDHFSSSSRDDDTANFRTVTKLTTKGGNSLQCNVQVLNCPIKYTLACRASGRFSVWCSNADCNFKAECRSKIQQIMKDNINEYRKSTPRFDTEFLPYIKTINDKLLEIKQKYPELKL